MARTKKGTLIAFTMLFAIILSACGRSASTPPAVTNPPIINDQLSEQPELLGTVESEVVSPLDVINTQTAQAVGTSSFVQIATTTPDPALPTVTPTPLANLPTTQTVVVTATLALPSVPASTVPPSSSGGGAAVPQSGTYVLQSGEFPYCIARRFNLNPDELLSLNGITEGDVYYAGYVLKLPATGNPFPDARALKAHPASYTVSSANETVYSIACAFGDVDPAAIASANGISTSAALTVGQVLTIP